MLGVLGGMGPAATVDFMEKVIDCTGADTDQENIPMIVCSASNIPDRTAYILGNGPDPLPDMIVAVRRLERAGATRIAIPCNTAHYWHAALQAVTPLPILHIVEVVCDVLEREPNAKARGPIGILATHGTLAAGIYSQHLAERGFSSLQPQGDDQHEVMRAIGLVKAGCTTEAVEPLMRQAQKLWDRGCSVVVMACTEIPVALAHRPEVAQGRLLDATDELAKACVALYKTAPSENEPDVESGAPTAPVPTLHGASIYGGTTLLA